MQLDDSLMERQRDYYMYALYNVMLLVDTCRQIKYAFLVRLLRFLTDLAICLTIT